MRFGVGPGAVHGQDLGPLDEASCTARARWTAPRPPREQHLRVAAEVLAEAAVVGAPPPGSPAGRRSARPNSSTTATGSSGPSVGSRREAGPTPHHRQVEGAQLDHVGPPHLHRHQAAAGQTRLVHLRHRGRGDGHGRELGEDLAQRLPKSSSMVRVTAAKGKGPTSSCSFSSALVTCSGTRSGRVLMICPTLMKVAPRLRNRVQHHLAEPCPPPVPPAEGEQQPQPAQPPAHHLLQEQQSDDRRPQDEARAGEPGRPAGAGEGGAGREAGIWLHGS
jgi:hypothetical protein